MSEATEIADELAKNFEAFAEGHRRQLKEQQDKIDRIATALNRGGASLTAGGQPEPSVEAKAFVNFVRHGRDGLPPDEIKALVVGDDTAGGYLAPAEFDREIIKNLVEFSPIRQAARVSSMTAGEILIPKRTGRPTAVWVGEEEERTGTEAAYGQARIVAHEMACYVDVSIKLLEDSAVDVAAEVGMDLGEEFGRLEGEAFVTGNAVKKPLGVMADTSVTEVNSGAASAITGDGLINILYNLPAFYRNRSAWLMNGGTLAACRTLKDGNGQYLWRPGLAEGQPETLLGRPVVEAVDMPDVGAGAYPIAVGDFRSAYRIYDRVGLSILRDPYTMATSGLIRFHARRRVGAGVVKAEALRKLKIAA